MAKSSGDIIKYIESLFNSDMKCDKKKKTKRKVSKKGSKKKPRKSRKSNRKPLTSLPARYSYYM